MSFCAIIDTGAQISLLSENIWKKLCDQNSEFVLESGDGSKLTGMSNAEIYIIGVAKLKTKILDIEVNYAVPFAIVGNGFPCCCILGANFLVKNNSVVNFGTCQLVFIRDEDAENKYSHGCILWWSIWI